jgi:endonuclease/exonuclease/phosphatase family metal-dependent hydrolase
MTFRSGFHRRGRRPSCNVRGVDKVETLRVGTLNIWNRSGPWPERLSLICEELARRDIGILGLQEVLRLAGPDGAGSSQADEIAEGCGVEYQSAFAQGSELGGGLEFGNAILSRYPIIESQSLLLPATTGVTGRCVLYALVDTPWGALPVFNTHLSWELHKSKERIEQVQTLVSYVFEHAPLSKKTLPPVVMGDFNAEPESDEIRYMKGLATIDGRSVYFADAWSYGAPRDSGDVAPGYTFDRKNAYAAAAHEPPRRIDYLFVRGPDRKFRGEPLSTELAFCDARDGVWPSDHFGVVTDLVMSKRDL